MKEQQTETHYVVGGKTEETTLIPITTIQARIAELEQALEAYVDQANKQVVAYQAAIGELKRLGAPKEEPATGVRSAA